MVRPRYGRNGKMECLPLRAFRVPDRKLERHLRDAAGLRPLLAWRIRWRDHRGILCECCHGAKKRSCIRLAWAC